MCIAANTTRFVCDDNIDSTWHRYAHIQEWTGCLNHPDRRLHGRKFKEDKHLKPCSDTPPVPIATSLCPDCAASHSKYHQEVILSHISRIMYRTAEVKDYLCNFEDLHYEVEGLYRLLKRCDFYTYLEPARLGEQYRNGAIPARDPNYKLFASFFSRKSTQYSAQLSNVYLKELFREAEHQEYRGESLRAEDEEDRAEKERLQRIEAAKNPEQRREDDANREWLARKDEEASRPRQMTQYSTQNLYARQAGGPSSAHRSQTRHLQRYRES
ncbi:uncharacterized protein EAF02_005579 [Botrytis sinoallii]|uniref:uncharacterized protein n=1 Tax=Botrytis sinoallii TaxID=1463999 RepID=UPI0019018936|nr:uncharacterized protein EAF02_005579 [Botrytis sinoallii]KAF7883659.1 hypothetical protein EAF02_005579 [Botrytis sinoallii]